VTQAFAAFLNPNLDLVWRWFEIQNSLIANERLRFRKFVQGSLGADMLNPDLLARFEGLTTVDTEAIFEDQVNELKLLTMLALLTTVEAILRIDYQHRAKARLKDPLSKKYSAVWRAKKERARLDEDLLTTLGNEIAKPIVSEFRAMLRLRHWLAHGRHWHPKLGRLYTPDKVFEISRALVASIA